MQHHHVDPEELQRAKELWEDAKATDWYTEKPQPVKDLYERFPPWKFYLKKDSENTTAYRILGVWEHEMEDGQTEYRLKAACGLVFGINVSQQDHNPETFKEVELYPDSTVFRLQLTDFADLFLNPMGVYKMIWDFADEE
jgi:hypothetical protein